MGDVAVAVKRAPPAPVGHNGGPPLEFEFERPHMYPKQLEAIFTCTDVDGLPARYSFIEASAQPLDEPIQTPGGAVPMGSLRVGDHVIAVDGTPTRVTGVFPLGEKEVFLLNFSDGTSTRACGDHLWEMQHPQKGVRVASTSDLLAMSVAYRRQWRFPVVDCVELPHVEPSIDPWLVGALIGDGSFVTNAISFSSDDPEMVDRVERSLPRGYGIRQVSRHGWNISANARGAGYERPSIREKADGFEVSVARKYVGRRPTMEAALQLHAEAKRARYGSDAVDVNLRVELRRLGLLGLRSDEKFIPEIYKRNSAAVRLEILRGIMDTDGSPAAGGKAVLHQTSARLAGDVEEIVRSLGGLARTVAEPPRREGWKPTYRTIVTLREREDAFWLPRKKELARKGGGHFLRKVVSIANVGNMAVQCISVEHDRQLYCCNSYIVTHNTKAGKTHACIAWLLEQAMTKGAPGRNFWWVAPVYPQAEIAWQRMKRALPSFAIKSITQNPLKVELFNGAFLLFKSAEKPDNLYGEDVYAAVLDEASRMRKEAWYAIRSTLTATQGPVRIIGNVKGRKNWFYELSRRAQQKQPGMAYHKMTAYDAVEGKVLSLSEIEDAKSILPEATFRELYLAEPNDDGGNPFNLKFIEMCVGPLSGEPPVAIGIDLAKSQDWAVAIALDRFGVVCGFERWQRDWEFTTNFVTDIVGNVPTLIDSTGVGDPIYERVRKQRPRVEGFLFTSASKQRIMEGLALAIQRREVTFPEGPIRDELEVFEYEVKRTSVRYTAPEGYHDDCVCALALAVEKWRHVVRHGGEAAPANVPRVSPWFG